jgi:hypothetical protein
MPSQPHSRTPEEKLETFKEFCTLYETGDYSVAAVCGQLALPERTFYNWLKESKAELEKKEAERSPVAELAVLFNKAKEQAARKYYRELKRKAKTSLEKLVEGFEVEETKTVFLPTVKEDGTPGQPRVKELVKLKKQILPHTTAVIFALTNTDPGNFKHTNQLNVSGELEHTHEVHTIKLPDGTEIPV